MRMNIDIDHKLIRQAMRFSGPRTRKAAVEAGLKLLIKTRSQASIRRLRGQVRWAGNLDESRASRTLKL